MARMDGLNQCLRDSPKPHLKDRYFKVVRKTFDSVHSKKKRLLNIFQLAFEPLFYGAPCVDHLAHIGVWPSG